MCSTLALLMEKSSIITITSETVPIFFTALAGQPSTGKSQAMNVFKNAFSQVESFYHITPLDSQQSNAGTIEALLELISKIPGIIGT